MLKAIGSKTDLLNIDVSNEYYHLVRDLINDESVLSMKQYIQHGTTTCYQHCINVSYYNYRLCKLMKLNARAGARAGLLHDLFLYDWHYYKKPKGEKMHGCTHPIRAFENAQRLFDITECEGDIIRKHMFPMTIALPRYKETVIIILVDKYCGLIETVAPRMFLVGSLFKKGFKKSVSFVRHNNAV